LVFALQYVHTGAPGAGRFCGARLANFNLSVFNGLTADSRTWALARRSVERRPASFFKELRNDSGDLRRAR
jgi:hypothetical protein